MTKKTSTKALKPSTKKDADGNSLKAFLFVIAGLGILAFGIVLGLYYLNFSGPLSSKPDVWGMFGDFLGGALNPILSFLALIALLYTIHIQVKELKVANQELKDSRHVFVAQEKTARQAALDNTFFKLLDHLNSMVQRIQIMPIAPVTAFREPIVGRECFADFNTTWERKIEQLGVDLADCDRDALQAEFLKAYAEYTDQFDPYFHFLATILRFIDNKMTAQPEKAFYLDLLLGQMSAGEVQLMGIYTLLHPLPEGSSLNLVEQGSLLSPLRIGTSYNSSMHIMVRHYGAAAFSSDWTDWHTAEAAAWREKVLAC